MKILIVHQYFLGKDDAGGSRWNQFAKYWAQAGHEVTILAGMVHYASGKKSEQYKGKFIVTEDIMPGVRCIRCHVSESYNRSFMGRAWAYMSFTFSSLVAGFFKTHKPDIVIATSPPLTVEPTMKILAAAYRVPCVFEVRDLWPESAIDTGVLTSKPLIKMAYYMESQAYKAARWINVLTPAFVDALVEKKNVPREKISMIPNGADLDIMRPEPKDAGLQSELGIDGRFVISYFGAHGRANKVGQLLDVAERIKNSMPDVLFMLVGDGMEKAMLKEDAAKRNLDNVIFVNSVGKEKVKDYINVSDICTAVLMKNDTFKTVYPNKVFDYMSCAKPIIIGIDGVARKLVEDAKAGLFAEPENPDAFIDAIRKIKDNSELRDAMGKSGLEYVRQNYDRKVLAEKYIDILQKLV
ncbi:MAG TPA: glycosyltransferase family 4 protein [Phycisphaerae bacterium]|nr:glycosyltransferase family 4 protein [Phycisphaerae bacterium]HPS52567.1 glycosyltransferase family 4 protein [Phycisphaerae bacterium]